jgi:hypothetical protein
MWKRIQKTGIFLDKIKLYAYNPHLSCDTGIINHTSKPSYPFNADMALRFLFFQQYTCFLYPFPHIVIGLYNIHIYICIYVYMYICIYVYTYIYIYIYIYIYGDIPVFRGGECCIYDEI